MFFLLEFKKIKNVFLDNCFTISYLFFRKHFSMVPKRIQIYLKRPVTFTHSALQHKVNDEKRKILFIILMPFYPLRLFLRPTGIHKSDKDKWHVWVWVCVCLFIGRNHLLRSVSGVNWFELFYFYYLQDFIKLRKVKFFSVSYTEISKLKGFIFLLPTHTRDTHVFHYLQSTLN